MTTTSTRAPLRALGIVTAVVFVVGGLTVALTPGPLRVGPLPWVLSAGSGLVAAIIYATRGTRAGKNTRWLSSLATLLALIGLISAAVFFGAAGLAALLDISLPLDHPVLGVFGVLIGLALVVGLPLGLIWVAVAALRDESLPSGARRSPLIALITLVAAFASTALLEGPAEGRMGALLFGISGLAWAGYAYALSGVSHRSSESRGERVGLT